MNILSLFIDELGSADRNEKFSRHYILVGCLANAASREILKVKADQIKFKYWGKTNIVFHSRDIGRKIGDFSIFEDTGLFDNFQKDLFSFLSSGGFQIFVVVLNKDEAVKRNWSTMKNYQETACVLIRNFVLSLLAKKEQGRLVIESATSERDFIFHKIVSDYLSNGIKDLHITFEQVQNVLTEISFVTKKNFDIEEQIADLFAYASKQKQLSTPVTKLAEYEKGIIKILKQKLFQMHPETGIKKKTYYSKINSFVVLP